MFNKKESKNKDFEKKTFTSEALDFIKDLIIISIVVFFIRSFLVMPFQISGQSMYSAYYDKEFIIVDRFSYLNLPYREGTPKRGDVIVFKPGVDEDKEYFIKRIVGLPGETLKIEGGKVYLFDKNLKDFKELKEGYLDDNSRGSTYIRGEESKREYKIPTGNYFVMGDNRSHSTDSRTCFSNCSIRGNYIKKDSMVGKVLLDLGYFNFKNFSFLHPNLKINTHPKFTQSLSRYNY